MMELFLTTTLAVGLATLMILGLWIISKVIEFVIDRVLVFVNKKYPTIKVEGETVVKLKAYSKPKKQVRQVLKISRVNKKVNKKKGKYGK